MLWLLLALLACDPPSPEGGGALDPDPAAQPEAPASLEAGLEEALNLWRAARYEQAQERVEATYLRHFQPAEARLRAADPARTLELEYAFGRLSHRMRRGGREAELAALVAEVRDDALAALAASEAQRPAAPDPAAPAPAAQGAAKPGEEPGAQPSVRPE